LKKRFRYSHTRHDRFFAAGFGWEMGDIGAKCSAQNIGAEHSFRGSLPGKNGGGRRLSVKSLAFLYGGCVSGIIKVIQRLSVRAPQGLLYRSNLLIVVI
jgi:hypothetical protein